MDRKHRVQIVKAFFAGIFFLFASFIGIPLVAALFWPTPANDSTSETMEAFYQSSRIAFVANTASIISLLASVACLLYISVIVAKWFVGPKEVPQVTDTEPE